MNKEIGINFEPRAWQKQFMDAQTRFTVLAVHRRAGKTTAAVARLIVSALSKPGLYVYIAPELKQARLIAWDILKYQVDQMRGIKYEGRQELIEIHETEPYIKFYNGSKILLLGADAPDRIRGVKLNGAIIDEVAQMPRELWTEVVYPALMDTQGWALFIGTPKGVNLFSELFYRGEDPVYLPDWSSHKYTCYETDALKAEEIEAYKRDTDENTFRREMLCDFTASGDDALITMDVIEAAMRGQTDSRLITPSNQLVLGVDVARYGSDNSVLFFRRGMVAEEPIVIKDVNTFELASIIKRQCFERKPDAIFVDGTGVGGGVVDTLGSFGIFCYDINFNGKASIPKYKNKRTEMWYEMSKWIRKGARLPNSSQLAKELAAPTYTSDEGGKVVLESKQKIKDRLGFSPDLADALALTFAEQMFNQSDKDLKAIKNWYNKNNNLAPTPILRYESRVRSRHNANRRRM